MKFILTFGFLSLSSFGAGTFINQDSPDITVIRARLAPWTVRIQKPSCTDLGDGWLDCTDFLDKYSGGPSVLRVIVSETALPEFFCRGVEIDTAIRSDALKYTSGIGFYFSGAPVRPEDPNLSEGRTIAVRSLKKVGWATLQNGEIAEIHRFIGLAACWQGSITFSRRADYEFKPFVEFPDFTSHNIYRNWDRHLNYQLSLENGFSFDRTAEVIR